jgi:two-component system nitrogen regulation response regulator NtrX
LKNIVERLVIMSPGSVIGARDIPPLIKGPEVVLDHSFYDSDSFKAAKTEFEKNFIIKKLREFDGNISKTAEAIGLERSNLHKKIKAYGLDVKDAG